jgi:hypothetical protein
MGSGNWDIETVSTRGGRVLQVRVCGPYDEDWRDHCEKILNKYGFVLDEPYTECHDRRKSLVVTIHERRNDSKLIKKGKRWAKTAARKGQPIVEAFNYGSNHHYNYTNVPMIYGGLSFLGILDACLIASTVMWLPCTPNIVLTAMSIGLLSGSALAALIRSCHRQSCSKALLIPYENGVIVLGNMYSSISSWFIRRKARSMMTGSHGDVISDHDGNSSWMIVHGDSGSTLPLKDAMEPYFHRVAIGDDSKITIARITDDILYADTESTTSKDGLVINRVDDVIDTTGDDKLIQDLHDAMNLSLPAGSPVRDTASRLADRIRDHGLTGDDRDAIITGTQQIIAKLHEIHDTDVTINDMHNAIHDLDEAISMQRQMAL